MHSRVVERKDNNEYKMSENKQEAHNDSLSYQSTKDY